MAEQPPPPPPPPDATERRRAEREPEDQRPYDVRLAESRRLWLESGTGPLARLEAWLAELKQQQPKQPPTRRRG